jgi:conjugal transfer pilus assembly protein TraF
MKYFMIIVHLFLFSIAVASTEGARVPDKKSQQKSEWYGDLERGWFFYEDPPEPPNKKEDKKKQIKPPNISVNNQNSSDEVKPFSVQWLEQNLPTLRANAIDSGKDEDIKAHLYAQRVMLDKAQHFADRSVKLAKLDPLLDETNRFPLGAAAKQAVLKEKGVAKKEFIASLVDKSAIWFFYDDSCKFCVDQLGYFKNFTRRYKVTAEIIAKDPNHSSLDSFRNNFNIRPDIGVSKRLNIQTTPAIVMVIPDNGFHILSQGLIGNNDLAERLVFVAEEVGLLTDEIKDRLYPEKKGLVNTNLAGLEGIDLNDPVEIAKYVQKQIESTYGKSND